MTPEKLLEIIGDIDEKYIEEADPERKATIIKFNFGALAGIAAGILAIVTVSNYMLTDYKKNNWESGGPIGVSNVIPAGDAAPSEEYEEYAAEAEDNVNNFADTNKEESMLQGNARGKDFAAANVQNAAENSMPEAVYEAEEAAESEDSGEALISGFTYFYDTPESVITAFKTSAAQINADTGEYFYMTENSKNILSPEYVRENIISDLSPKALESDTYIYYITQHKNDIMIGYIAIDENGNILENKLEG